MKSFPQPDDRNIRLYLTDKMTQAEHLAMETQIGSNPALVQQIQMEANLRFVHRYSIDFERIETLHAIQNSILIEPDFQFPDSGTAFALRNFVHKLQWWKIFAGVALVTGLVFSWLQWTNQQTVQLIQIELIPYPNTLNAGPTSPARRTIRATTACLRPCDRSGRRTTRHRSRPAPDVRRSPRWHLRPRPHPLTHR